MELTTILLILRPFVFAAAALSLLILAIIRRAYWYQVLWLMLPCFAQAAFMAYTAHTEITPEAEDIRAIQFWSAVADVYMGVSVFVFVVMLIKSRTYTNAHSETHDSRRSPAAPFSHRLSDYQRLTGLAAKRWHSLGVAADGARTDERARPVSATGKSER